MAEEHTDSRVVIHHTHVPLHYRSPWCPILAKVWEGHPVQPGDNHQIREFLVADAPFTLLDYLLSDFDPALAWRVDFYLLTEREIPCRRLAGQCYADMDAAGSGR